MISRRQCLVEHRENADRQKHWACIDDFVSKVSQHESSFRSTCSAGVILFCFLLSDSFKSDLNICAHSGAFVPSFLSQVQMF
jgi:hypothetical protein